MYYAIDSSYTIAWASDVSETSFTEMGLALSPIWMQFVRKLKKWAPTKHWWRRSRHRRT